MQLDDGGANKDDDDGDDVDAEDADDSCSEKRSELVDAVGSTCLMTGRREPAT